MILISCILNPQGKIEQMNDHIKKLKLCIKWFQNIEEGHVQEQEKLQFNLESAQRKSAEIGWFCAFKFFEIEYI